MYDPNQKVADDVAYLAGTARRSEGYLIDISNLLSDIKDLLQDLQENQ